jgi:hypothetical protein
VQTLVSFVDTHPLWAIGAAALFAFALYFFCKQVLKAVFLLLIVVLMLLAYQYLQYPDRQPSEHLQKTCSQLLDWTRGAVDGGRKLYDAGKGVYEKGKTLPQPWNPFREEKPRPGEKPGSSGKEHQKRLTSMACTGQALTQNSQPLQSSASN